MLTKRMIEGLIPRDKIYRRTDGRSMSLEIHPNGRMYWHFMYRYGGRQKRISFGVYPEVSIGEARDRREECRKMLREGKDPSSERKRNKLEIADGKANTFEKIAEEYLERKVKITDKQIRKERSIMERYVYPHIGRMGVSEITAGDVLCVLRLMEGKGILDTAHNARSIIGQVLRYATAIGKVQYDVTAGLRGAMQRHEAKHFEYFNEKEFREFLERFGMFDDQECPVQNELDVLALKLLILTFVRKMELLESRWEEIDLEKKEWRIPSKRMKMKEQHIIPLSRQAINVLNKIKGLQLESEWLFPQKSDNTKPMYECWLSKWARKRGYNKTLHGIRSTASTILNENGFSADAIERQLAHSERNKVRAVYNHAQFLNERREMMDWWGNYIDMQMKKPLMIM